MVSHAGEDVGEPGLWIDVVELGGDDHCVHEGSPVTAPVGSGEEPAFPAESQASERPLGGVVCEADPAIPQEGCKSGPSWQHVVDCLGDMG